MLGNAQAYRSYQICQGRGLCRLTPHISTATYWKAAIIKKHKQQRRLKEEKRKEKEEEEKKKRKKKRKKKKGRKQKKRKSFQFEKASIFIHINKAKNRAVL